MKRPGSTSSLSHSVLWFVALGALTSACNTDPGKGKVQAAVASAAPVATPTAGSVNYTFSNGGSKIEFVGAKVTAKHEGAFAAFRGTVALVDGDPTKSRVTAEVDVASLTVQPDKLAGHLKSADFFDAERFPKAQFSSTAIKSGADNGATHTVTGNLDLHGVTKSLTFPAKIAVSPAQIDVLAEFSINRKDFAIVYPGMPDDLIKDDVLLRLSLHAKK